ncbi:bifunctional protein-serine/threonine kinase/phosphatase [uncultured Roseobacter sp.]|uniref:bifunctional protein-serine/threonine kinase/phosphatase n=1 Tax=uncultured Roseobacter sp. TaxID=114847 RepID=UPI0026156B30|nr:bifunctional protein-serine/threonine kinase/phosphatase [uncultured Roseobacter sp.]
MPKDARDTETLAVSVGRSSSAGVKAENQDAVGAVVPSGQALRLKGVALAVADGISTSPRSREAAEATIKGFLSDYYDTSDTWEVKTAARTVISATNAWLHGINRRALHDSPDHGHICTLAALILKGQRAHLFHVGDSRIWRMPRDGPPEPLTLDHVTRLSGTSSQLSRAIGLDRDVAVDYRALTLRAGDVYLMTTDGVHDHWAPEDVAQILQSAETLDHAAAEIVARALAAGSRDNLTIQIVRVDAVPEGASAPVEPDMPPKILPLPEPGDTLDGFDILRQIHSNNRSHIFLARGPGGQRVALKMPATETASSPALVRLFQMEEWIARRVNSPHVVAAADAPEVRSGLYVVTEFIEGQTLRQWMRDRDTPQIEEVRDIATQMIRGLRALHRRDMLHQDFRPENLMIDKAGHVKIIDLGSVRVLGVDEAHQSQPAPILGTVQYTAPEYFVGDPAGSYSDQFSLGVTIYEMLTGRLPFGAQAARVSTRRDRARLTYAPAVDGTGSLPYWIDDVLRRATHPDHTKRFPVLSELETALRVPPTGSRPLGQRALLERHPLRFWQATSAILGIAVLVLIATR